MKYTGNNDSIIELVEAVVVVVVVAAPSPGLTRAQAHVPRFFSHDLQLPTPPHQIWLNHFSIFKPPQPITTFSQPPSCFHRQY
jgi:hypothetical protein